MLELKFSLKYNFFLRKLTLGFKLAKGKKNQTFPQSEVKKGMKKSKHGELGRPVGKPHHTAGKEF